ncbi:unnamed protein product [Tuber melanosporum]|uniref:(Perigord truffle) hypothetical protein n=1 Tax=Tuber melanosporum (strain Mel28) TaxID=656061 RepID=D5GES6_TUBMM|nr:uncharacterized protein GSTUM_00006594001 [Tuber melanosporum]CAZ83019.1 unnamed protein product [Tuber melanosporum]
MEPGKKEQYPAPLDNTLTQPALIPHPRKRGYPAPQNTFTHVRFAVEAQLNPGLDMYRKGYKPIRDGVSG